MTHKRKTIRDATVALLKAASITGVGNNVFSNRLLNVNDEDLPVINVITKDGEDAEIVTLGELGRERRDMDLVVEVVQFVTDADNLDDALDALAEEVEAAMRADHSLSNSAMDSQLNSTDFETDTEGQYPIGRLRLNYIASYMSP